MVLTVVNVPGVPADRRWTSLEHGTTWRQTLCPGDLRGTCPAYTLDNVFGPGKAYGFFADGVHAFAGAGRAGPRLALSDWLPCRGADVLDVGGGSHTGDPILPALPGVEGAANKAVGDAAGPFGHQPGGHVVPRSADAGASWRKLDPTAGW